MKIKEERNGSRLAAVVSKRQGGFLQYQSGRLSRGVENEGSRAGGDDVFDGGLVRKKVGGGFLVATQAVASC